jgi:hypothetical protein
VGKFRLGEIVQELIKMMMHWLLVKLFAVIAVQVENVSV